MRGAFWASGSKKAVSFPMMNFQFCQYMFKPKVGQNSRATIVPNHHGTVPSVENKRILLPPVANAPAKRSMASSCNNMTTSVKWCKY